jgi:hypothetical protein
MVDSQSNYGPMSKAYYMIGPSYVHGVMDGEMFEEISESFDFL